MTRFVLRSLSFLVIVSLFSSRPLAAQGLTPEAAAAKMTVPDGFMVSVVASEPLVRQPVAIEFDDRGRLWVIQYLQYPNPEGLKRVQVDRFSRTKYDRVPEPPPHGPKGADRITILEDSDGDGRMDRGKDFVSGLNLTTGLAFGHGGVFVLNVPYLLFYPDRDRDDVPDTDPEVLLTGFGMEDAHSVANSLTWGPDGWLYGCQGSTVTANIRGIEFQQGVWRYHPLTREFELFCEGGGNSWGLDFDRTGRLFYSTNYGGFTMVHGVQGGYYVKSFGKHGALHNPHTYGYFEHVPHREFRGGHVTVGGIVYQGGLFPESFRGTYIAGDLLGHGVYWHAIQPRGSTVQTVHAGELVTANDTWFAPTDVTTGPDGAVYVCDWHDARTAHPDPDADWDRSNGRIYRIAPTTASGPAVGTTSIDLSKLTDDELLRLHDHVNQWFVRRARQELVRRYATANGSAKRDVPWPFMTLLRSIALKVDDERYALESLWTLNLLGGFDEPIADDLLNSPHPSIRAWTIRLLGDKRQLSAEMAHRLDKFAEHELSIDVRQQLACSAARFPANQAMPMINANINRDIDTADPYLPLLWWWAVERHSVSGRDEVLRRFVRPSLWKSRLGRDVLLTRLIRRYAAEGTVEGLNSIAMLLKAAPTDEQRLSLWPYVLLGWQEQRKDSVPPNWIELAGNHEVSGLLLADMRRLPEETTLVQFAVLLRHEDAIRLAIDEAFDAKQNVARRVVMFNTLGAIADRNSSVKSAVDKCLTMVESTEAEPIRAAALQLLGKFDDEGIAERLIAIYRKSKDATTKTAMRDVLLRRHAWARRWVGAVEGGEVLASETTVDEIRRVTLFDDRSLDSLVTKHWGKLQASSREEKLAEVRRLNNDVRAAAGDSVVGQAIFKKNCATCHQLFGEGTKLGPDLTTANRQDRDYLLVSLVDPSAVIRKEFVSVIVQTTGGQVITGLPIDRDDSKLTLVNAKNEKTIIPLSEIEDLKESPVSIMPDDLYRQLKPQDLRDLFAYLQRKS